jgi:LAGLIDADG endonuclease
VGNRGSKTITGFNQNTRQHTSHNYQYTNYNNPGIVKEQRVDGSCTNLKSTGLVLRCRSLLLAELAANLLSFEKNFLIKNLSNQVVKRNYTTRVVLSECLNKQSFANFQIFNPWFITGFTDAEGSFVISVVKDPQSKTGWNLILRFKIDLHIKDLSILEVIQKFFGGIGRIASTGKDRSSLSFVVSSRKEILTFIIPHFDSYPLLTQKRADYELFKLIITKMERGEHLTSSGLLEIINIRASINLGLSPGLKAAFPHHTPVARPLVEITEIPHPQWVVGFTSGEGCFYVVTSTSVASKVGFNVRLRFIISQHTRDEKLMGILGAYFNCGIIERNKDMVYLKVTNFSDNLEKIIPFFKENGGLAGTKQKDFNCWSVVAGGGESILKD